MKAISLFSGVGGMDLGLHRAGFEHVAFCEADPYRREVLARHWPGVPVHDDVRTFEYEGQVDLLAGGFPCQDLSVAGKRKGLAGERSGLFYDFARIADSVVRPGGFLLIENVPGLLSSNSGRDMAIVVRTLADLGFASLAYRTLDSQFFRVPQRRRRVFIVGCRAESDVPEEVLALAEGSSGNPEEGGEARQDDPRSFGQGVAGPIIGRRIQRSHSELDGHGAYVAGYAPPVSGPITKRQAKGINTTMDDGAMVVPAVTRKWAKGSGGPAGDECQNLVAQIQ
jgi:DNA (cytosine-5)-methyltransferase 1